MGFVLFTPLCRGGFAAPAAPNHSMPLLRPRTSRTSEGEPGSSSGRAGRQPSFSRISSFLRSPKPESSSYDLVKAERAATVVQARLRGNQARKQQEEDVGAVTAVQARLGSRQSRKAMQAAHKAELKAKKPPAEDVTSPGLKQTGALVKEVNDHATMVEAEHASTVMQAGLRGYIARNRSLCQHTTPRDA